MARKRYYKVSDIAKLFNLTPQAVYYWIEKGHIKTIRTPAGNYLIPASEYERIRPRI